MTEDDLLRTAVTLRCADDEGLSAGQKPPILTDPHTRGTNK